VRKSVLTPTPPPPKPVHTPQAPKKSKGGDAGKFAEVANKVTDKLLAKEGEKGEAERLKQEEKNAHDLAAANARLAAAQGAGRRRLAGCDKGGACPPPKTPEPVVYVVKDKKIKEAAKPPKTQSEKEIAKDTVM
jgi:hypothetical protein